jgi:hypothetical protein
MRRLLRALKQLEVEEQILCGGALLAAISVFFPWFGGDWFGEQVMWNGLQFYTSITGFIVLLSQLFVLVLTILPLFGHELVTPPRRDLLRFIIGLECMLLLFVVITIFARISFESPRTETRFGVYMSLVGSIVVSLYSFLRMQQRSRREVEEFFRHEEPKEERQQVAGEPAHMRGTQRLVGTIRIPRRKPAETPPPPEQNTPSSDLPPTGHAPRPPHSPDLPHDGGRPTLFDEEHG